MLLIQIFLVFSVGFIFHLCFLDAEEVTQTPAWSIQVYTGSKDLASTTADVNLILYADDGQSSEILLTHGGILSANFAVGQVDTFSIPGDKRGSLTDNSKITDIELWMSAGVFTNSSDWFLEKLIVTNENSEDSYTFPWLRWVTTSDHLFITLLDTYLPQTASVGYSSERADELEERRSMYQLAEYPGYVRVEKTIPTDDNFQSADYNEIVSELALRQLVQSVNYELMFWTEWQSVDDIKALYEMSMFDTPPYMDEWDSDVHFGRQRLIGVNHNILTRVIDIPSKLPVTDDLLADLLEGMTIKEAIGQKRLFTTDLEILKDITASSTNDGAAMCAPIALYFENSQGDLVPVAIQLFQEPGENNPIFTPDDPYNLWTLAKIWYNNADGAYHQAVTHMGKTHYLMEGVYVAMNRQLSPSHPVYKLLKPHFYYTVAIDDMIDTLHHFIDSHKFWSYGIQGMLATIEKAFTDFELNTIDSLSDDLQRRGLDDLNILPGYHARNDAVLLYSAIHKYVESYVGIYYTNTDLLEQDFEIQSWAAELSKDQSDGGIGIRGLPGEGALKNTEDLVSIVTNVVYTASCGHAMAHFGQYEAYGFPPNYPLILRGSPPKSKTEEKTMRDVLDALPNIDETLNAMRLYMLLDNKRTKSLGYFEIDYIYDPKALVVLQEFRDNLDAITDQIKERNKSRSPAYEVLLPENIPNAVSI